jgi:hypothetical protein
MRPEWIRPAYSVSQAPTTTMPTLDTDLFYPFLGFAGLVTVASLWNFWSGEMFPAEKDPTGSTSHCLLPPSPT